MALGLATLHLGTAGALVDITGKPLLNKRRFHRSLYAEHNHDTAPHLTVMASRQEEYNARQKGKDAVP